MHRKFLLLLCISLLAAGTPLHAQSKKKLQDKKKKLQSEIRYTEKKVKETREKQKESISQLEKINRNIEDRTELIQTYESEIRLLDNDIVQNQQDVKKLDNSITSLKQSYAQMVYFAWLNRNSMNKTLFILASDNLNQAFYRARYFNQITQLRKERLEVIRQTKQRKEKKLDELKVNRESKTLALTEQTQQANELQKMKKEKETIVTKLRSKEKELLAQVEKKKKEADQLTAKINAIVEKIKEKPVTTTSSSRTNSKTNTKTNTGTTTVKEGGNTSGGTLSNGFENNKGKLPWPVEKGFISGKYGVQPHPVLERVEIKNDGVDISTDKGASVRSVYKGEISGVFIIDGYQNVVIIRHGQYLTVYSHLASVSVSKGASVETKQKIGTVATDDEGKTYINFQVRQGNTTLNPGSWLSH